MPRTSIKGQVLADLVAEFAECLEEMEGENQKLDERSIGVISVQCLMPRELYVDGAANQQGSEVGLVLVSPKKIIIEKSLRLSFSADGNDDGPENGGKGSESLFKLKIGSRSSKR